MSSPTNKAVPNTCPSCGAHLRDEADRCALCGTPVDSEQDATEQDDASPESASAESAPPEARSAAADAADHAAKEIYCTECGAENPPVANFCSQCGVRLHRPAARAAGAPLAAASAAAPSTPAGDAAATGASSADTSRRVLAIVGVAVLLVAGLYGVTTWSKSQDRGASASLEAPAAAEAPAGGQNLDAFAEQHVPGEMPAGVAARVDSVEALIAGAEGVERRQLEAQRVNLLVGGGAVDRAALAQRVLAEEQGTTGAWRRAGRLLHDWMSATREPAERQQVARLAIGAYEQVLQRVPDDTDARTMLATAYIETNNPMRGVQEIKRVLEQDPEHVQALFNYGIMLALIGRAEQSIEQFEKVQRVTEPQSAHYREAGRIIETIRQRMEAPQQAVPDTAAPATP